MRWKAYFIDFSRHFSSLNLFQLLLLIYYIILINGAMLDESIRNKCRLETRSCSDCIKQHPDCAWCADTRTNVTTRCDVKAAFIESGLCAKQHLYSPANEVKIAPQHNLPLDTMRSGSTAIQLEPQQVEIRLKPGDVVEVPFQYLHKNPASRYEVRDFTIQTSEFISSGLQIDFVIQCHGESKRGRVCPSVKIGEKTPFVARVSLRDCSNHNIIPVSVGIYGYNTVSALFVTPLCGCECEGERYQDKHSPHCGYRGNLVCGVCVCDPGRGGEQCECELSNIGVSSANQLIKQCRENEKALVCSGKGKCNCGKCSCEADYIRGRFCECDNSACPLSVDGRMCSGRGECRCGKCACERGFTSDNCACTDDQTPCTENGVICSGHGFCECGKCACNARWTGATCSVQRDEEGDATTNASKTSTETGKEEISSQSSELDEDKEKEDKSTEAEVGDLLPAKSSNDENNEKEEEKREEDTKDSATITSMQYNFWQLFVAGIATSITLTRLIK